MNRMIPLMSGLFTSLVLLAGCGIEVGSGRVVEEQRPVGAFKRISIHDGIRAEVAIGERSLQLATDDNVLPLVETFVEGDTLHVRVAPAALVTPGASGIRATVVTPQLLSVSASGGSHVTAPASPADTWSIDASGGSTVTVSGLETATLEVSASGGSELTLTGMATDFRVKSTGGSVLYGEGMSSQSLDLDGSGGSVFEARVSAAVRGHLSGRSKATIIGTPAVQAITTSGDSMVNWRQQ